MDLPNDRISRAPSLSTQVHNAMRESIMAGTLEPGQRLIVDRLAERYGVSPTPVREAIARLVQDGIVVESGRGKLRIVPVSRNYVRDTYWVRSALEGLAAELASTRMSPDEVRSLRELITSADEAIEQLDFNAYEEQNQEFHWRIVASCGNQVLISRIEAFQLHVVYIRQYFLDFVPNSPERLRKANSEHLEVVNAISHKRSDQARYFMEQHVRNSGDRLGELLWREDNTEVASH